MPWVDLGEVVGKDGEIGNVNSTYINNGGDPGVNIVRSGDDGAPDFTFEFENLANDPLSESELEQIVAGQTVSSASVVNGTVLSNFMSALGSVFAAIDHKHDASDIDSGTLAAERIANDSIGTEKFKPAVRDSLSQASGSFGAASWVRHGPIVVVTGNYATSGATTVSIGTIPNPHRPKGYTAVPITDGGAGGYAEIGSGGTIKVVSKGAGTNFFSLAYIAS